MCILGEFDEYVGTGVGLLWDKSSRQPSQQYAARLRGAHALHQGVARSRHTGPQESSCPQIVS